MQSTQAITILLVDNHALIRSGVSLLLTTHSDFDVIGQAGNAEEALELAEGQLADVVVVDIDLPGSTGGLDLVRELRRRSSRTRILVLTNVLEPVVVHEALHAGVTSYLLKTVSIDELALAIRAAHRGIPTLSPQVTQLLIHQTSAPIDLMRALTVREQEVLELMSRGWNNQQIGRELNISLSTVQFHVGNILSKLAVHNRTEAATFALRHQIISGRPLPQDRA